MSNRNNAIKCPNLNCNSLGVTVVETYIVSCGSRIRRRRCECCGQLWYTAQPPEQQIETWRLIWGKRRAIALLSPAESTENGKV